MTLLAVTDGLNRVFSNDIAPLRLARDLGLAAGATYAITFGSISSAPSS